MIRLLFLVSLVALAPLLAAEPMSAPSADQPDASTEPAAPDVPTDPDHVLQPQDVIRVEVFQEDDINAQCEAIPVSQDSTITLPLIGLLSVKDKTVRETRELIRSRYDKDYLVNPQVALLIVKYAERFVNVVGCVTRAGHIEFPNQRPLTILDAITLAGGPNRLADLDQVKITRLNDKGSSDVTVVDVTAMMTDHGAAPTILKPGDIVYVPERAL
jgi:polysaccharide export outer membrane protein